MKQAFLFSAALLIAGICDGSPENGASGPAPQFTKDNELLRPTDYREWIYLSSGLGMNYGPSTMEMEPAFDNVFVHPAAYRAFLESGKWPDKTIFVLEVRSAKLHGSINKSGHFQGGVIAVEAAVKDVSRFPEKWAYFGFGGPGSMKAKTKAFPANECHSCHSKNAAVENTFVQFYPTLLPVAEAKGTLNASYPREAPASK